MSYIMLIYPTICIIVTACHPRPKPNKERAFSLLKQRGMVRLSNSGKLASQRQPCPNEGKSLLLQLSRGLYQLPDASVDTHHSLAEAAKLVPKGIVCLTSALAFHGLTDTIASRVWMAIGAKHRRPSHRNASPPIRGFSATRS